MRIVYTAPALSDLEDILDFIAAEFPAALEPFRRRLRLIELRIGRWPESAPRVAGRPGVRVATMPRYPYKVFYLVGAEAVEILHIHHAARREP
jgi:plasmid stabilization system protein ParE